MRSTALLSCLSLFLVIGCTTRKTDAPIVGTWELVSATATENDSTYSTFNPKQRMIKIINPTHFAFLLHDLNGGKDSASAAFTAGGGDYTLVDSTYTENLTYFIDRRWENNKFNFSVRITDDSLVQKGVEKVENLGIDRVIVETYKRVK